MEKFLLSYGRIRDVMASLKLKQTIIL